ncbi:hypothetical protein HQ794_14790 [Enterococcus faecium]|nr:hypothetical protein [Enterococcus faecium]
MKKKNDKRKNEYEKIINKKVEFLCKKQINLIDKINSKNFKQNMQNLIEIDSKIDSYLFFLIHDEFLDYKKIDQIVENESIEEYYIELSHNDSDSLNHYKLIKYS